MFADRRNVIDPYREWDDVLRAYAAALDEHRSVLTTMHADGIGPDPALTAPRFVPPSGIGSLPAALHDRAVALLTQTAGLVELASQLSADLADAAPPVASARTARVTVGTSTMEQRL